MTISSDLQARVQTIIDDLVSSGEETGVQVCAYQHGEVIVDAVAGLADSTTGRPVLPGTPFCSFSTGKGVTATVVHVLAEQGRLDVDRPIAEVWPEFAQHGKESVTLRHALTHTTGIPALPLDTKPEEFADWDHMCAVVAGLTPLWTPGSRTGYHAWTYGWIVGEVVRRVTGQPISQVLAEQVAGPLGVADELFLAVPRHKLDELARLEESNWSTMMAMLVDQLPHLDEVAPPAVRPSAELGNRRDYLQADVPACGTMSARAVARMYAALLGAVDGVRLVGPERLPLLANVAYAGPDWAFGDQPVRWTLGYGLEDDAAPGDGAVFGVAGSGGSLAYAIPGKQLAIAATKNRMGAGGSDPMEDLRKLISAAVH